MLHFLAGVDHVPLWPGLSGRQSGHTLERGSAVFRRSKQINDRPRPSAVSGLQLGGSMALPTFGPSRRRPRQPWRARRQRDLINKGPLCIKQAIRQVILVNLRIIYSLLFF
jgi:hypothetical protein